MKNGVRQFRGRNEFKRLCKGNAEKNKKVKNTMTMKKKSAFN